MALLRSSGKNCKHRVTGKRGREVGQIEDKERYGNLTPLQECILGFIAFNSLNGNLMQCSKGDLAKYLRCPVHKIDRAVRGLRDDGYIVVEAQIDSIHGQTANAYKLAGKFSDLRRNPNPPQRAARAYQSAIAAQ